MADTEDNKKDDESLASSEDSDVTTEAAEGESEEDQDALADEWAAALAEQKDTDGEPAADPDELLNQAQASSSGSESADPLMGAEKRERKHKPDPEAEPLKPEELAASPACRPRTLICRWCWMCRSPSRWRSVAAASPFAICCS